MLCALLERGLWRGPSLLLAPATRLYDPHSRLPVGVPVVIVQGLADEVVPIELGRALAATGDAALTRLHEVDDDHRLTRTVESGRLLEYVREAHRLGCA